MYTDHGLLVDQQVAIAAAGTNPPTAPIPPAGSRTPAVGGHHTPAVDGLPTPAAVTVAAMDTEVPGQAAAGGKTSASSVPSTTHIKPKSQKSTKPFFYYLNNIFLY